MGRTSNALNQPETCIASTNGNVILPTAIILQYFIEKGQPILVEATKISSSGLLIYPLRTTLGCIMHSRKNTLQKEIINAEGEILFISAEKLNQSEDIFIVKFDIKPNIRVYFNSTKFKMIYEISKTSAIYRSECLGIREQFNPINYLLAY